MRATNFLTFAMTLALPAAVLAQRPGKAKVETLPKTAASRLVVMPASDLKWTDLDPGAPGVKVADLWGNHAEGAFGAFFTLPAGFAAPLHTHTYDMKVVIISGTYIQAPEGSPNSDWHPAHTSCSPVETIATPPRAIRPPIVFSLSKAKESSISSRSIWGRRARRSSRPPQTNGSGDGRNISVSPPGSCPRVPPFPPYSNHYAAVPGGKIECVAGSEGLNGYASTFSSFSHERRLRKPISRVHGRSWFHSRRLTVRLFLQSRVASSLMRRPSRHRSPLAPGRRHPVTSRSWECTSSIRFRGIGTATLIRSL